MKFCQIWSHCLPIPSLRFSHINTHTVSLSAIYYSNQYDWMLVCSYQFRLSDFETKAHKNEQIHVSWKSPSNSQVGRYAANLKFRPGQFCRPLQSVNPFNRSISPNFSHLQFYSKTSFPFLPIALHKNTLSLSLSLSLSWVQPASHEQMRAITISSFTFPTLSLFLFPSSSFFSFSFLQHTISLFLSTISLFLFHAFLSFKTHLLSFHHSLSLSFYFLP